MKSLPILLTLLLSNSYAQQLLTSSIDNTFIGYNEIKSTPPIPNTRLVYIKGEKYCYLSEHMTKGFRGTVYCWKGDIDNFNKTISAEAKLFIDSISNRYSLDIKNANCVKLNQKEGDELLPYLKNYKYAYFSFERTYDCFEKRIYKNFKGRIRIKNDSKLYLIYMKGDRGTYEQLGVYVIS